MPRQKSFSDPIYTRLPEDVMEIFEELREESGKSKSEFARELITARLVKLKIQKAAAMSALMESGKAGSEAGKQARMAMKSVLEGDDDN